MGQDDTPTERPPLAPWPARRDGEDGGSSLGPTVCRNCGATAPERFCPACGQHTEQRLRPFREWFMEGLESFFSLDAVWWRSLVVLLTRPGALTLAFLDGQRIRFTYPMRLYIVTSAVTLALASVLGSFDWARTAEGWTPEMIATLATLGLDFGNPLFVERFEHRFATVLPVLNLLSPIGLALALKVVFPRRYFEEHAIFALHYATFIVVAGIPILFVRGATQQLMGIVPLVLGAWYGFVAVPRVYGRPRLLLLRQLAFLAMALVVTQILSVLAFVIAAFTI